MWKFQSIVILIKIKKISILWLIVSYYFFWVKLSLNQFTSFSQSFLNLWNFLVYLFLLINFLICKFKSENYYYITSLKSKYLYFSLILNNKCYFKLFLSIQTKYKVRFKVFSNFYLLILSFNYFIKYWRLLLF